MLNLKLYIILYTTYCPKCTVLKNKLDEAGLPYRVEDDINEMLEIGIQSAPALSVNGTIYSFHDALKWIESHHKKEG